MLNAYHTEQNEHRTFDNTKRIVELQQQIIQSKRDIIELDELMHKSRTEEEEARMAQLLKQLKNE